jgi:hypothetical protein
VASIDSRTETQDRASAAPAIANRDGDCAFRRSTAELWMDGWIGARSQPSHLELIDSNNANVAGDLIGITLPPTNNGVLYVDDFDNTLRFLH